MRNKNLVFTSAGDNTNFYKYWLNKERKYDLMVVYYGNKKNKYKEFCEHYFMRKGSKFQNFYYIFKNYKYLLDRYEAFFILDDDIIIKTVDINNLFKFLKKYKLWIISPTYDRKSKISHIFTMQYKKSFLRYCNFIELGIPLFSKYAIYKFMNIYDPSLVGFGIDYLYIWALGQNIEDKYALCDQISCINPFKKIRSIDILQSKKDRIKNWLEIKKKFNIKTYPHKAYKIIYRKNIQ